MNVKIITDEDNSKWEDFVVNHPDSIAWQSLEWNNVLKKHFKFNFFPIAAFEGSEITGILPIYRIKTILSKEMLISVPYAVAGGIVGNNDHVKQLLLDKVIDLSKQFDSCSISLKQYKIQINAELKTDKNYYNKELDLKQSTDNMWNSLDEKNRQKISETDNMNIKIEYPSTDVGKFYKLLLGHSHRNGIPLVSKKWINDLVLSNMYSIALLRINGNILAGTMIKKFKKTVSFPFSCYRNENIENMTFMYRLYWNLISRFSEEGFEIFHSGRIPNSDHTDPYRLGWGGIKYNYYYQYYPFSTVKTEFTSKQGGKRELFKKVWRYIPKTGAQIIGPKIAKLFP